MRGDPKGPWDYLLEGEPLVVQASPIRFSVVGAHLGSVYQLVVL